MSDVKAAIMDAAERRMQRGGFGGLDAGLFCVEGPMTDDRPWRRAALRAKEKQARIQLEAHPDGSSIGCRHLFREHALEFSATQAP